MTRVTDGTRTRDVQDHNLALYQLSYGHQLERPIVLHSTSRVNPALPISTRHTTPATPNTCTLAQHFQALGSC